MLKCRAGVFTQEYSSTADMCTEYFAAVLPGSTNLRKLCCKMFKTLTNIRSFFQGIRCVCLEVSDFFSPRVCGIDDV